MTIHRENNMKKRWKIRKELILWDVFLTAPRWCARAVQSRWFPGFRLWLGRLLELAATLWPLEEGRAGYAAVSWSALEEDDFESCFLSGINFLVTDRQWRSNKGWWFIKELTQCLAGFQLAFSSCDTLLGHIRPDNQKHQQTFLRTSL